MKSKTPLFRFLIGLASVLLLSAAGFLLVGALIPTWGASAQEAALSLPGDELIPQPQLTWTHAMTIHAAPEQIYPWLVQMGDTRAAFYSYTFIENLFMLAGGSSDRYVNANSVHPEWQQPPKGENGQGIIMNMLAIKDYRQDEYVLASATETLAEMGMGWTWLWYLQPLDADSTRLIVRHGFTFPAGLSPEMMTAMLNAGYVMERGMMLGIRDRAEGRALPGPLEGVGIALWLATLACGITAAVRFIRQPGRYHPLGVGLEALAALFLFTFVQPPIVLRIGVLVVLLVSLWIEFYPGKVSQWVKKKM